MVRVKNSACVRRLALKSLRANRARNTAAVLAIALTSLLFTALFTITMSVNASFQESNFRMVGGYAHGSFKRLTPEQYDELKGTDWESAALRNLEIFYIGSYLLDPSVTAPVDDSSFKQSSEEELRRIMAA